ncbi:MAG TPA: epoxide hydrolase N-terminal domain-containing protein, partial [Acidimicrobiales bacterium]|nr:epoxide hydrolase N-terminal domain-containing protein [Acidimicrobiales bacterium]
MSVVADETSVQPFRIDVPQVELDDLRDRLAKTRWPDELDGAEWAYGVPLGHMKDLVDYWLTTYDWGAHEAQINTHPQFTTTIDGQSIH